MDGDASYEDFHQNCDSYLLFALLHSTVHAANHNLIALCPPIEEPDEKKQSDIKLCVMDTDHELSDRVQSSARKPRSTH
jgi:hypothetical protein